MADVMVACTEQMLERWEHTAASRGTIDVVAEMMGLTQAIIVRTMFSTDLGVTSEVVNRTWPIINRRIGETFWSTKLETKLPLPANRRFQRALRELDAVVYRIIAERRESRREEADLLSMFLSARDEETGAVMTDRQLRDEVMTMLLAGHEEDLPAEAGSHKSTEGRAPRSDYSHRKATIGSTRDARRAGP